MEGNEDRLGVEEVVMMSILQQNKLSAGERRERQKDLIKM